MHCPKCHSPAPSPDAVFCEHDGARLVPENATLSDDAFAPQCRCGAESAAREGEYCGECGRKWPFLDTRAPEIVARDHVEIEVSPAVAAVSDLGRRHAHNQDDIAIGTEKSWRVLVVCDGVSSAWEAASASRVAAKIACDALKKSVRDGVEDGIQAVRAAIVQAQAAVCTLPTLPTEAATPPETSKTPPETSSLNRENAPATTIVAALLNDYEAFIGWAGDSRAYWINEAGAQQITRDHSWVNEVVDAGQMSELQARKSRYAHAITRCLGTSEDEETLEDANCEVVRVELSSAGTLLLCSDGLWNYAPQTENFASLLASLPADHDALTVCRALCAWANAQGGRDNISVALAKCGTT